MSHNYLNQAKEFIAQMEKLQSGKKEEIERFDLEEQIGKVIVKAFNQETLSEDFLEALQFYKKHLKEPISLDFSSTHIQEEALALLKDFPVDKLRFLYCSNLTTRCLKVVGEIAAVKSVELGGNDWVNNDTFINVPATITSLSLSTCKNFTGEGLAHLEGSHVTELDLSGCFQLKDEEFLFLPKQLKKLDISQTHAGSQAIKQIGKLPFLRDLTAIGAPFNDEEIKLLKCPLVSLNLSGCRALSDEVFNAITQMEKLETLSLSGTKITGKGFKLLPQSLKRLSLNGCRFVTNEAVIFLSTSSHLKFINLHSCDQLEWETIEAFNETNIQIAWQEPQPYNIAIRAFAA